MGVRRWCTSIEASGKFTLRRLMQGGTDDQRSSIDVHHGDLDNHVSEAAHEWDDLERENVERKSKW